MKAIYLKRTFVTTWFLILFAAVLFSAPSKVMVVGWDGAVPEMVKEFAAEGRMPTISWMMENGNFAYEGGLPVVVANTNASWPSVITGSFPGTHGITNNSFHYSGTPITASQYGGPHTLQAESFAVVAELEGYRTAVLGGPWASWPANDAGLTGPNMGWGNWHSKTTVISNYDIEGAVLFPFLFMDYYKVELVDAEMQKIHQTRLNSYSHPLTFAMKIPTYHGENFVSNLLIVDTTDDSIVNYDLLASVDSEWSKVTGSIRVGEWLPLETRLPGGKRAGLYVKLLNLSDDAQQLRLFVSAMQSTQIFPEWLDTEMAEVLPIPINADRNAIIGGFVDEETFFESCLMEIEWYEKAYQYVIERTNPDVVFAWFWEFDEFAHRMFGFLDKESPVYSAEEYQRRYNMFRKVYQQLDKSTEALWNSFGGPEESNLFIVSDHGFVSYWKIANINERLARVGLYNSSDPSSSKAIAYSAGAATQIYINLIGREPTGVVSPDDYEAVQKEIIDALNSWIDENGAKVIAKTFTKEETKDIDLAGRSFSLFNEKSTGDVLAFAASPYQFDAATPGQIVTDAVPYFTGQHGYLLGTVPEMRGNIRTLFAVGGALIKPQVGLPDTVSLVDIAPTMAAILGIREPATADGLALTEILCEKELVGISD